MTQRAKYEAPKLEVQKLRELPSALATSGKCHVSNSKHECESSGK